MLISRTTLRSPQAKKRYTNSPYWYHHGDGIYDIITLVTDWSVVTSIIHVYSGSQSLSSSCLHAIYYTFSNYVPACKKYYAATVVQFLLKSLWKLIEGHCTFSLGYYLCTHTPCRLFQSLCWCPRDRTQWRALRKL